MKDPEEARLQRHNRDGQLGPGQAASSRSAATEADFPKPASAPGPELLGTGEAVLFSKTPQRCHNPGMMSKLLQG